MANKIKDWNDGDVLYEADLEAEFANIYAGTIDRTAGRWGNNDDIPTTFGSSQDCSLTWNTTQTQDTLVLGLSGSKVFLITDEADKATNYGLTARSHPSLIVHSSDETSLTEYIEITNDGTDAVINIGASNGDLVIKNNSTTFAKFSGDGSTTLKLTSTVGGLVVPVMTQAQRNAIAAPEVGMIVFDTDNDKFYGYESTGFTALA